MEKPDVNVLNEADASFRGQILEMVNKYTKEFAHCEVDVESPQTFKEIFGKRHDGLRLLYMALHITQFPIDEFAEMDVGTLVLHLSDNRDGDMSKKQVIALIALNVQQVLKKKMHRG